MFQPGFIYPLKDATRYDDELGTGFDHIAIAHDADGIERCFILDAWIADREGNVHPGYGANPVPIRIDDVAVERGRPLGRALPEPMSVFMSP